MSEEDKIEAITARCYQKHADQIVRSNFQQKKTMRQMFLRWVTLPVSTMILILGWVLLEIYGFKGESERRNVIMDTQTISIGVEAAQRDMSDTKLAREIEKLDAKMNDNMQFLIQNMSGKYRGANPLTK